MVEAAQGIRPNPGSAKALARALLLASLAATVSAPLSGQEMRFRHLGVEEGLALSWVQSMVQDRSGFMWFGTGNGLVRHDGYSFKIFRSHRNDTTTIGDNRVNALLEDEQGVLWAATRVGISRFDRATERFRNYVVGGSINALVEDGPDLLWAGSTVGVYRVDRRNGRSVPVTMPTPPGSPRPFVHTLFKDSRGHVWIGTRNLGTFVLDPATNQVARFPTDSSSPARRDVVRGMYEDAAGRLWMATYDSGLVMFDPGSGRLVRYLHDLADPNSLAINSLLRLLPDGQGRIWIGTENGGLEHFDPATGRFRHYRFDAGDRTSLSSNSIWSLFRDRTGSLWVGTFAGGVNVAMQNSAAIRTYHSTAGDPGSLSSNAIIAFAEDRQGIIWIATDGGGLNRFDPGTGRIRSYTTRNSNLNRNAVMAVATDRAGGVWVGTWGGGLSRFDPRTGRFTAYTKRNSNIPDDNIFAVCEDRLGRLWVGTWNQGLLRFDPERRAFTRYRTIADADETQIWQIRELEDGRLALGTLEAGLALFDPATHAITRYASDPRDDNTLSSPEVRGILEGSPGRLWVATANGLDDLDLRTRRITHVTEVEGLPTSAVTGVARDGSGRLWLSTEQGLVRYDRLTKRIDIFTPADGLQGNAFTPRAFLAASDGVLYFGGNNGFSVVRPDLVTRNPHLPPVVLTDFRLLGKPVVVGGPGSPLQSHISLTREIRLRHDQNVFSFEFAALDYIAPAKNQYAYKLDGVDQDWQYVGTARSASYAGLPPGRYLFHVKASNNDGIWNEQATSLGITITPPFWSTWWFRTMIVLLVVAGMGVAIGNYRRRHRYLARNVHEILAAMRRSASGDHSIALPVTTGDEIGELRQGINTVLAERNRAEEELRHSQKMEAIGQLAGGVAHDFNNLLTVILGNTAVAMGGLKTGVDVQADLEEVQRAAERAESVTQQLLAFGRKQILQPRVLSLNEVVRDLARMLQSSLAEDIELRTVLEPALGQVRADRGQIEQVLLNLAVNARDAMPRGGVLTVQTANVPAPAGSPETPRGPWVALIVEDTGCGMTAEIRARAFEPFFTTKPAGKGTGLGLATVYGIAKQSDGDVLVESEPGVGSRFTVYLPRVDAEEAAATATRREAFAPGAGTVLLAEDEDALRRLAARVLVRQGYTVLEATSGTEGLALAAAHTEPIDLLLTDMVMPGMNGRELAEQVLLLHPGTRVAYMSGYTEDEIVRHGAATAGTPFLPKPFTPADLVRFVREVLRPETASGRPAGAG